MAAKDLKDLSLVVEKIENKGIKYTVFHEPDILNEPTAICIEPNIEAKKILNRLPLVGGKKISLNQEQACAYIEARFELTKQMTETGGINYLQHGIDVFTQYKKLIIENNTTDFYKYELFETFFKKFTAPNIFLVERYHTIHDCGKTFVKELDIDGKIHYPNHSSVSAGIVKTLYSEDEFLQLFVQNDMLFHNGTFENQTNFLKENGENNTLLLLVTAYCAIHANRKTFGEESFRIKIKTLLVKANKLFGKT